MIIRTTFIFALALSSGFLANAQTYNVSVETQVGGKIEDRFNFTMQVGQPQYKGFDSKYWPNVIGQTAMDTSF